MAARPGQSCLRFLLRALLLCTFVIHSRGDEAGNPGRVAKVAELLRRIEPAYRDKCASVFRGDAGAGFSQAHQDWYIAHNIFRDRLEWGGGSFLDIGANAPTWISNTLFLEKCLGWRGVCFEPQASYHEGIRKTRSCQLIPNCVFGHAVQGVMTGGGGHARLSLTAPDSGAQSCVVARDALTEAGFRPGVDRIDFLSIDIEGAEPEVLRCFPLDAYRVGAVLIEVQRHDRDAITLWFNRRGYVLEQTFLMAPPWQQKAIVVMDHLYVRRERPAVYPPGHGGILAADAGLAKRPTAVSNLEPTCALFKNHTGHYCHHWRHWAPRSPKFRPWGPCLT
jgi:FkbM family methyltransferase